MWRALVVVGVLIVSTWIGVVASGGSAPDPSSAVAPAAGPSTASDSALAPAPGKAGVGTDTNVTFAETGLPAGTDWEVSAARYGSLFASFNSSSSPDIREMLPDGAYNLSADSDREDYQTYGAAPTLDLNGVNTSETVHFWLGYDLTFLAAGLPFNSTWNVSLTADGLTQNHTVAGPTTEFWIPQGNYSYQASADGFASSEALGASRLSGNSTVAVDFARPPVYPGTLAVTLNARSADFYLNGILHPGIAGGSSTFTLTPGIWIVYVTAPGYLPYYNSTTIRSNQTVSMPVTLAGTPANPAPPLLSAFADVIIVALVTCVVIIGILFWVASQRLRSS
jgi:hypothetical protein